MKSVTNLALLALLLMTPACEMLGDIAKAVNFNTLLASITDAKTAEQAKPVLDVAVAKLDTALTGAKKEAAEGGEGVDQASMVQSVLTSFGVTPETSGTINTMLANPAISTVLGGTLNQLMGLINS
jgi:hypothetical protein